MNFPRIRRCLAACFLLLPVVFGVLTSGICPALAAEQKTNILILSSYHVGYKWSDDIYRGILDELEPLRPSTALHVEYMDMKRYYTDERFDSLFYSLSEKYKNITIDYVISADDSAFLFLKTYLPRLFPGAKVIFCGTNYLDENQLTGLGNFFGVTERADIRKNFQLIFRLHPDIERIYIINDDTLTGKMVAPYIDRAVEQYRDRAQFIFLKDLSMTDLLTTVASIPDNSVIFYTFCFRDAYGKTFEYDESATLITDASRVPVYGAWDFNLGFGIVGGMLTSGYHQGVAAGMLTRQFLEGGVFPESNLLESPNRYMFDYAVMRRYDIPVDRLPADSIIINRPETFLEKHRQVLLFSVVFIATLIVVIIILAINISMRRKVEIRLQQSEKNFRGIFENAVEGLFQATLEGRFLRVNPALAKILKCDSPKDVLAHYKDLKKDLYANPDERLRLTRQILERGSAQRELDVLCKDGSTINVLLNCHNVVDGSGRHLYLEGSMTDMTEYKMTQEIIIQTEKMLSLGGLSAGIAHEIKNPLTSMIQASQIISSRISRENDANRSAARQAGISEDGLEEYLEMREIPELLENIVESGKRANIIVEDMLSFSRKNIGEFEKVRLQDIIGDAIELAKKDYSLRGKYGFKKITIHHDYDDDIPPLYCSRSKICQVVFNILKNSAEAMEEAGTENPAIRCSISSDDTTVRLIIADNGPGMDEATREKLFEPFFTTKGGKKGTGLGLSVSYFIVCENHKGALSVDSSPGTGASFRIELPIDPNGNTTVAEQPLQ